MTLSWRKKTELPVHRVFILSISSSVKEQGEEMLLVQAAISRKSHLGVFSQALKVIKSACSAQSDWEILEKELWRADNKQNSDLRQCKELAMQLPRASLHLWSAQLGQSLISKAIGKNQPKPTHNKCYEESLNIVYCLLSINLLFSSSELL